MTLKPICFLLLLSACVTSMGQEVLAPLSFQARPSAPKSSDTLKLELPFFDDFANYEGAPDHKRWLTYDALVNKSYAWEAPTIGIVTLDALDKNGNLYPQASTNLFAADTLASQIIRLDSLTSPSRRALRPSDSIYLSFYYLPGGWYGNMWERIGDAPSQQDSLFLEFFSPTDNRWHIVWSHAGHNADTAGRTTRWPWTFVNIKIDDEIYFTDKFQFRFRNYASLDANPNLGIAGNCDQWNIDYIYLNYNRNRGDSLFRDIAFVEKAPSLLKNYQAVPYSQYRTSDMVQNLDIKISNRYNQTLASNYSYTVVSPNGQTVKHYDGGYENILPFYPGGRYQTMPVHSEPPVQFSFPLNEAPSTYQIIHVVREGVGGDIHTCNDTIVFSQIFDNYYAYDDGSPENGYGLTAPGSKLYLAYRFELNQPDTLTAVDIYFNRTRNNENEDIQFHLCIWDCENGRPGTLIYKDDERMNPEFEGLNRFHRYILSQAQVISDTVFVGFEQLSNGYANIGFDRNTDSRERLYYRTSEQWQQSILSGSLMFRPVFGQQATVSISQATEKPQLQIELFPNPAHSTVNIRCTTEVTNTLQMALYDTQGRKIWQRPFENAFSVEGLPSGLYLLNIIDTTTGQHSLKKIIISH